MSIFSNLWPFSRSVARLESKAKAEVFTFGDPVPVLDFADLMGFLECVPVGKWYEPPISFDGLAKSMRAAVHHASSIYCKRNILEATYIPNKLLSLQDFSMYALNFLVFGNGYIERKNNRLGNVMKLEAPLAKYMRRGVDMQSYWYVPYYSSGLNSKLIGVYTEMFPGFEFSNGSIFHLLENDINQDIYGLPDYLSALNSIFLNESATLFRRKYYENGSHAGFVFYISDTVHDIKDVNNIKKQLKESKGRNNFKNLFLYAPGGKKDGIQIIPLSEVMAKDEFLNIKKETAGDQLAAHRIPPQLMGIVPANAGGFGDAEKAAMIFAANEIGPLQAKLASGLNNWLGQEVVKFRPYAIGTSGTAK